MLIPLRLSVCAYMDFSGKKLLYSIKLYKYIMISSGVVFFTSNSATVKFRSKKAKTIMYKDILADKSRSDILKILKYIAFEVKIILGGENNIQSLSFAYFINILSSVVYSIIKSLSPNMRIRNDVVLLGENHNSGLFLSLKFNVNIFKILYFIRQINKLNF